MLPLHGLLAWGHETAVRLPLAVHLLSFSILRPPAAASADADEATMAALLGEQPRPGSEQQEVQGGSRVAADVKAEPAEGVKQEPAGGAGAAMDVDGEAGGDSQQVAAAGGEQHAAAGGAGPLQASGSSAQLFKEEPQEHAQQTAAQPPAAQQQQQPGLPPRLPSPLQPAGGAQKPPLHPNLARVKAADSSAQPSSAGVSQSGAEGGGTETDAGTTVDQEAQPLRPVSTAPAQASVEHACCACCACCRSALCSMMPLCPCVCWTQARPTAAQLLEQDPPASHGWRACMPASASPPCRPTHTPTLAAHPAPGVRERRHGRLGCGTRLPAREAHAAAGAGVALRPRARSLAAHDAGGGDC